MATLSRWHQVCAAMDVVSDTEWAIDAFLDIHPDVVAEETKGDQYLAAYGVLQAMFLQQDAIRSIHKALEHPLGRDEVLMRIRAIRNDSIGHPTDSRSGRFHFIVQHYLSRRGYQLMSFGASEEDYRDYWVDLPTLASSQRVAIANALATLLAAEGVLLEPLPSEEA